MVLHVDQNEQNTHDIVPRQRGDAILDVEGVGLVVLHRKEEATLSYTKLEIWDNVGGVLPFDVPKVSEKWISSLSFVDKEKAGVNGGACGRLTWLVKWTLASADVSIACGSGGEES